MYACCCGVEIKKLHGKDECRCFCGGRMHVVKGEECMPSWSRNVCYCGAKGKLCLEGMRAVM